MLGSYVSPGGGTVITSGSTDWAHGLAGRDDQIEQITATFSTASADSPSSPRGPGAHAVRGNLVERMWRPLAGRFWE